MHVVNVLQRSGHRAGLHQILIAVAGRGNFLFHDLRKVFAGIAVVREILLVVLVHAVHGRLRLRLNLGERFVRQHVAIVLRIAQGNLLAQLAVHGLLSHAFLQLGVVLVHLIAILRAIADVGLEHLVKLRLHLGAGHLHGAVIGRGQHDVLRILRKARARQREHEHRQQHKKNLLHVRILPKQNRVAAVNYTRSACKTQSFAKIVP